MEFLAKEAITRLQNHSHRKENLVILKRKSEELLGVMEDIKLVATTELQQPRKKLKRSVEIWFQNVKRITGEINDLQNEATRSNFLSTIGEKVVESIQEVDKLFDEGKSFDGLVIDDPQWIGQVLSPTQLFGEVPKKLMEEIWEYLTDDGVSKIGVYGMGGVGKTTVMKLINNQLLKETGRFDKVIWVTVSKEINITQIQNSIAGKMNNESFFKDNDDEITRAGKLYELLVNLALKGKYVLILDDLWDDNLSLEEVGIPEPSNGSKLVVTTRSLDVCRNLDCKEIKIPTLPQSDAWNLFLEKVGKNVEQHPKILPFVRSVANECDGLPLAIITIASSMKDVRDIPAWRNALYELRGHVKSVAGVNEKIFQKLQFSYDRLGDENVKLCFLFCALYPEDFNIEIDELINLWIAEGYVGELKTMLAEIDRGRAILKKLKNCCLIEDGDHGDRVKLHDVVRDMALHLTSSRPRFFVRAGMQLKMIPDVREWKENLEKVSLMKNDWLRMPSQMSPPNCPILTTLLLSYCYIQSIPECLFEQMPMLRILDLSWNDLLTSLPNSISNLESLTTLLLRECNGIEEIPSVSKLKNLKQLDLRSTGIEEVPHGIDELVKLRYLDLSYTKIRKMDVGLILEKLTSLLYLNITPYDSLHSGIELGGTVGIKSLAQLEGLEMKFRDLEEYNRYMQTSEDRVRREGEWHHHCMIVVGDHVHQGFLETGLSAHWGVKSVGFNKCKLGTENIKLLSDVENLAFDDITIDGNEGDVILSNLITCCGDASFSSLRGFKYWTAGIKKLFSFHWASHNLVNLEKLSIDGYDGEMEESLEEIIWSESEFDKGTIKFPRLRRLWLSGLPKLKSICSEKVSIRCDSIEEIGILFCPKLKRIPIIFPLGDDGLPSPPASLKLIGIEESKEWWESAEWDQPQAKSKVEHLVTTFIC